MADPASTNAVLSGAPHVPAPRERREATGLKHYLNGNPTFLKWACMLIILFWTFIYKLSDTSGEVGGFVYARF